MSLRKAADLGQPPDWPFFMRGRVHPVLGAQKTANESRILQNIRRWHRGLASAGRRRGESPLGSALAMDTPKRSFAAASERGHQMIKFASAKVEIAFTGQRADGPAKDSTSDLGRYITWSIGNEVAPFLHAAAPLVLHCPFERRIGFGEVGRGMRDCSGIEPFRLVQGAAYAHALEPLVMIAWVGDRRQPGSNANFLKLRSPPAEQRTDQPNVRTGCGTSASHSRKPANARASSEAHEDGFGLVIGMVGGGDCTKGALFGPIAEQKIALVASALLERGLGNF